MQCMSEEKQQVKRLLIGMVQIIQGYEKRTRP
jgi:hypothetical protein